MFKRDGTSSSPVTRTALAATLATTVVILPQLPINEGQAAELPEVLRWAWLVALLTTAPVTAYVVARLCRRSHHGAMALAGVPQVVLTVALIRLDTWLDVRSGYLLAGSGEEAMAYGLGTIIGALLGLVLAVLVTAGALLGSRASRRRPSLKRRTSPPTRSR